MSSFGEMQIGGISHVTDVRYTKVDLILAPGKCERLSALEEKLLGGRNIQYLLHGPARLIQRSYLLADEAGLVIRDFSGWGRTMSGDSTPMRLRARRCD